MTWTADFVNNPNSDFDLCVDIMEGEVYRATIFCDNNGVIKITIYPSSSGSFEIPAKWLAELLHVAMQDLQKKQELETISKDSDRPETAEPKQGAGQLEVTAARNPSGEASRPVLPPPTPAP